jgi:hypothetical protein
MRTESNVTGGPKSRTASHRGRGAAAAAAGARGIVRSDEEVLKEHAARTKVRLVKWMADTMNPLGAPADPDAVATDKAHHLPGGESGDAVASASYVNPMDLSNADLVDALTRTLVPGARALTKAGGAAGGGDPDKAAKLRLKQLEQRLQHLHLGKVRLRQPQGAKAQDNVISLQQLVTALYVMNVADPVVIV